MLSLKPEISKECLAGNFRSDNPSPKKIKFHAHLKKCVILLLVVFLQSIAVNAQENPNFYLHENGVTVICTDAEVGETGEVDGITYTKRSRGQITTENAVTTCTSDITKMNGLFVSEYTFNGDISSWDVSSVTDMSSMFLNAENFNRDLSSWDVSSVTDMSSMFAFAEFFNSDLGNWDVSSVTNMSRMFSDARSFNRNINSWDVSSVTDMSQMFVTACSFNSNINSWDVSSVTNMKGMFSAGNFGGVSSCQGFNRNLSDWDVSSVTDMSEMYYGAIRFRGYGLSNWDVSSVSNMSGMFSGTGLTTRNYDMILVGWSLQDLKYGVTLGALWVTYSEPGRAARNVLMKKFNWKISGDEFEKGTSELGKNDFILKKNYPNPFDVHTTISYEISEITKIRLEIYNIMGQRVALLDSGYRIPGNYELFFDATELASGKYLYRLTAGDFVQTRQMTLIK